MGQEWRITWVKVDKHRSIQLRDNIDHNIFTSGEILSGRKPVGPLAMCLQFGWAKLSLCEHGCSHGLVIADVGRSSHGCGSGNRSWSRSWVCTYQEWWLSVVDCVWEVWSPVAPCWERWCYKIQKWSWNFVAYLEIFVSKWKQYRDYKLKSQSDFDTFMTG